MTNFCRHCHSPLEHSVIDLGHQPPSNAYLSSSQLGEPELHYPLKIYICTNCWLMQVPEHTSANKLFTRDYAYFSSTSTSWCDHARNYVENAVTSLELNSESYVVELASNDGYLLQYFKEKNIPCLGIEPTHATAEAAKQKGINTIEKFFTSELAQELKQSDLIIANNVLAHVPDTNDFMLGIAKLMTSNGKASIEFPHLLKLINEKQFDTIYHEHYSYFSLRTVKRIAKSVNLEIFDVETLSTHGGSLRVWLGHNGSHKISNKVAEILTLEDNSNLEKLSTYADFERDAEEIKFTIHNFLSTAKKDGLRVLGYGAAAKGNTLLNYAGIKDDLLPAIGDLAKSKQGKFMPGSHIPIVSPETILSYNPDILFVLPWNLIEEVQKQIPNYDLLTAIPKIKIWGRVQ